MNTGEHGFGGRVQYEQDGIADNPALTELRGRLGDGLARNRINKTELARRSGLGRTTVSGAFQTGGPVPSAHTVQALARALKLPVEELLALQRDADAGGGQRPAPGRPIGQWEPHALEVHPAGPSSIVPGSDVPRARELPGYVKRGHDLVLAEAVRDAVAGRSRMVVLVGGSSTGKTRACWEAVQPLANMRWKLWHPFDPTRAEAALDDLHRVAPETVVWLNEAQHYLGDREAGERVAAALHGLLTTPERGPVLVLGTLWPEYAARYTAMSSPGREDPYSRVRELLSGRTLTVPDAFDAQALAAAATLARDGDRLLADALTRAGTDGRVTQDLAGAPELLNRYERATPAARAVLEAAMDARRLGVGLHLPQAFLIDAAADYLTDTDYDRLTEDWAEQAFAELAEQVHGKQAPLRNTIPRPRRRPPTPSPPIDIPHPAATGPMFRLADYLEQHGRTTRRPLCPPASFWHAAFIHLTHPDDLNNLIKAAQSRHRLQWAHHLRHRAADHGDTDALFYLTFMRERAGDGEGAEHLYRQAADLGDTDALSRLAEMRERAGDGEGAEHLARQAADLGNTDALSRLAEMRERAGDREGAERLYRQAADLGDTRALSRLAEMREKAGEREGAERIYREAADLGNPYALSRLAFMREEAGDREGAEHLARQAADLGDIDALSRLVEMRERAGDGEGAEHLAQQAADLGTTYALSRLAEMREEAGDREGAEHLYRQAADLGNTRALSRLAEMREEAGDREGAERLYRQAADLGNPYALSRLAFMREETGDREGAEHLARQAADLGTTRALSRLAEMREKAGDREGAEHLARQTADLGNTDALSRLAEMREKAGDREGAEHLAQQTADLGNTDALSRLAEMREEAGDREGAEHLAQQAADLGNPYALSRLAFMREETGDGEGAEHLARQAADLGDTLALFRLAEMREEAGDGEGAEHLARQAADLGTDEIRGTPLGFTTRWPDGLDPGGTPTRPWQCSTCHSS
ncbi:helix-turn-helix domain-containing protein [Streptomyces bikiniensis]|uniref:helix-turn-helix domain-containing protein n=1 Tax=Streptomyces bikiniensis TaxID=1896 RepID=UPI0007C73212|nr:helix-turn-helix domain-containing protein [Streptomyces bikiniensis]